MTPSSIPPEASRFIVRSWHEWEIDGRELRLILVIETDVEMRAGAADYDSETVETLRAAAVQLLRETPDAIDKIRIVPVRT